MKKTNYKWWAIWAAVTMLICGYNAYALLGPEKTLYLAGETTHGHYQIEMACDSCHGEAFSDEDVIQKACMNCHQEELQAIDDSHPRKKFTDPRNADRVAILDARYCVTCHLEHKPQVTQDMAVTLADDFCVFCHEDVAEDRESHVDLPFDGCSSAGCHNYHDNSALYEDFLVKHAGESEILDAPQLPVKNYAQWLEKVNKPQPQALKVSDADSKLAWEMPSESLNAWAVSKHAEQGVNCVGCHEKSTDNVTEWIDKPDYKLCKSCHEYETKGFQMGKHGMRTYLDLAPMQVADARQPMKEDSHSKHVNCSSCHSGHEFNTRKAAVEACLSCHDDQHSLAYEKSSHYQLWVKESQGINKENSGVSCATCHLPRQEIRQEDEKRIAVQHNQSLNLRPNEKMLRTVCMQCHGYEFSVNALADRELIQNNFLGKPTVVVDSTAWAVKREKEKKEKTDEKNL